jgi:hypothetical protein
MRKDLYECERHAVTTADGEARRVVFERCMRGRGYAPRPAADQ